MTLPVAQTSTIFKHLSHVNTPNCNASSYFTFVVQFNDLLDGSFCLTSAVTMKLLLHQVKSVLTAGSQGNLL